MDGQAADPLALYRVGWAKLTSSPSRTNCVDISPSGVILVRTDDAIHILHIGDGLATSMSKHDGNRFQSHRNSARRAQLYQSTVARAPAAASPAFKNSAAGGASGTDYMTFDTRFISAEWAPYEWGPLASPMFAALTTDRQLTIYHATAGDESGQKATGNQIRGPWRVFSCVNTVLLHEGGPSTLSGPVVLSAFTWLSASEADERRRQMWLIGGSVGGTLFIWKLERKPSELQILLHDALFQLDHPMIYAVSSSSVFDSPPQRRCLAIASAGGLHLYFLQTRQNTFALEPYLKESQVEVGKRIHWMRWFDTELIYCTPGEIHYFNAVDRRAWTAYLGPRNEESGIESFCFEAPADATRKELGWKVTLRDGSIFLVHHDTPPEERQTPVSPVAEVAAPLVEIADVQRKVERLRGLLACHEDGSGLSYLCFDANEIAAWSYHLNKECHLDIALDVSPKPASDAELASSIFHDQLRLHLLIDSDATQGDGANVQLKIDRSSWNSAFKRRQFLSLFFSESSRKGEILNACSDALLAFVRLRSLRFQDRADAHGLVQIALLYACWLKEQEEGISAEKKSLINDICSQLERMSVVLLLGSHVYESVYKVDEMVVARDPQVDRQALVLAASAMIASNLSMDDAEAPHVTIVKNTKGASHGAKLLKEWVRLLTSGKQLDLGELCPACEAPVMMGNGALFLATCRNGHRWRRCSTTRSLLSQVQALQCVICSHQAMLLKDAVNDVQRAMLQSVERCTLCGGAFIVV